MSHAEKAIVDCWKLDGEGGGTPIAPDELPLILEPEVTYWLHLNAAHPDTDAILRRFIPKMDDLTRDTLLEDASRPRTLRVGDAAVINLRGVNLDDKADPSDMVSVRMWVECNRVITLRNDRLEAIANLRHHLKCGEGPVSAADFLTQLIYQLFDGLEPLLTDLDNRMDKVEDAVMDNPDISERRELVDIRITASRFRRHIAPQREALSSLRAVGLSWLNERQLRMIQDEQDRVARYVETLDSLGFQAQIIKDELNSTISDRLNRNLYTLTMITSIFLTNSAITGLLGINVDGIPGAHYPHAFEIVCAMLLAVSLGQVWLFRRLRWF